MKWGLNRIFWGFIIITFHINIGPIPILPDFIGYILIGNGLYSIINIDGTDESFLKARKITTIMVIISIINLLLNIVPTENKTPNILMSIYGVLVSSIAYVLYYYIIKGLKEEAIKKELFDFARSLERVWYAILACMTVHLSLLAFNINFIRNEHFTIVLWGLWILILIVRIVFLRYLRVAYNECEEEN
ncbi:hypothetical protein [Inconstantimicrobium mannanitabidum]|uniref:Uncharacterized protein n=1 Tax=Inconstantimicrobium mannanitabidum TaxID=1604901 RepID=A0ACB5RGA9_9CLOT|nr:hypothetical protein [Clostridium sp. TW13]GKX68118.1 hypothetical protein rsdtw13_33760 [Clostridium sp. TW13]